jgi:hypothetical protein
LHGLAGVCIVVGAFRERESEFQVEGAKAFVAILIPIATLVMVLPNYLVSAPGPYYSPLQLAFVSAVCVGLYIAFLFIETGYTVTSFDLSTEQLEIDRQVVRSRGLSIECLQGDMLDLSSLDGRKFDLIYRAISACYITEVLPLYRALGHLLPEGGSYWVERLGAWSSSAYKIVRPQLSGVQHEQIGYSDEGAAPICWHFIHPLSQLIGGLFNAGFIIEKFVERPVADLNAEPGSHAHVAAYVPPFFAMMARRRNLR